MRVRRRNLTLQNERQYGPRVWPVTTVGADPDLAPTIYPIAQGALANVVKEARAKRVIIRLAVSGTRLRWRSEDDGSGFEFSQRPIDCRAGLGLASRREWVNHLSGEMERGSLPGQGCRLLVSGPMEVAHARSVG